MANYINSCRFLATCLLFGTSSQATQALMCALQVPLMSAIVDAWLHTVNNRMGIFDTDFDAKAYAEGTATDCEAASSAADDTVSTASPTAYGNTVMPTSQVDGLEAHHLWIGFFLQAWQVCDCVHPPTFYHCTMFPSCRCTLTSLPSCLLCKCWWLLCCGMKITHFLAKLFLITGTTWLPT